MVISSHPSLYRLAIRKCDVEDTYGGYSESDPNRRASEPLLQDSYIDEQGHLQI